MVPLTKSQQAAVERLLRVFPAPPGEMPEHGVIFAIVAVVNTVEPHLREWVLTGAGLQMNRR
jgi:hypothetical protein